MKPISIYDLSRRQEVEAVATKQKSQQLPLHLQIGSVYDLNHTKAATEHFQTQLRVPQQEVASIYNCSIKH
ncbi:MAG: hypothetical protein M0P64_01050 [Candidatus Pacebacteria bacterium]|jgi:hypothetical protein|nr:hypothetical protein [Candidatus Paceibacterota bacterium]